MQMEEPYFVHPVVLPSLEAVSTTSPARLPAAHNATETPALAEVLTGLRSATKSEQKAQVCSLLASVISSATAVKVPEVPVHLLRWLWHTAVFDPQASPAAHAAWT